MNALTGKRVLVTRPRAQAAALIERLEQLGAVPVVFPTIQILPPADPARLERAIHELPAYRWVIFTSVNGVEAFWQVLEGLGLDSAAFEGVQVAVIGPATAQALVERGVMPAYMPEAYVAEAILPGLGEVRGQRILLPRADIARKALVEELHKQGALCDEIAVYRTLPADPDPRAIAELERGIDIATFTSSSTVRSFFELLGERAPALLRGAQIACIGPITAQTAREYGLDVDIEAETYTVEGLVQALLQEKRKIG